MSEDIRNISTIGLYSCYLQAEKPTAQSSTFHFFRASKNKKSLPFPTTTRIGNDEIITIFVKY